MKYFSVKKVAVFTMVLVITSLCAANAAFGWFTGNDKLEVSATATWSSPSITVRVLDENGDVDASCDGITVPVSITAKNMMLPDAMSGVYGLRYSTDSGFEGEATMIPGESCLIDLVLVEGQGTLSLPYLPHSSGAGTTYIIKVVTAGLFTNCNGMYAASLTGLDGTASYKDTGESDVIPPVYEITLSSDSGTLLSEVNFDLTRTASLATPPVAPPEVAPVPEDETDATEETTDIDAETDGEEDPDADKGDAVDPEVPADPENGGDDTTDPGDEITPEVTP